MDPFTHMVPVIEADADSVRIGDPLDGVSEKTREDFLRIWHKRGIYLVDRRRNARTQP